jgi:hypothetical protein
MIRAATFSPSGHSYSPPAETRNALNHVVDNALQLGGCCCLDNARFAFELFSELFPTSTIPKCIKSCSKKKVKLYAKTTSQRDFAAGSSYSWTATRDRPRTGRILAMATNPANKLHAWADPCESARLPLGNKKMKQRQQRQFESGKAIGNTRHVPIGSREASSSRVALSSYDNRLWHAMIARRPSKSVMNPGCNLAAGSIHLGRRGQFCFLWHLI